MQSTRSNIFVNAQSRFNVRKLVTMAMLSAIGVILVTVLEIPIFPAAPFLKYDPADIPILIGTLIYGPLAGFIMTVLVSFIQEFMIHGSGGPIGFIMHVCATGAMVVAVGLIAGKLRMRTEHIAENGIRTLQPVLTPAKARIRAAVALICGTLTMTAVMIGLNLILTPIFMGTPRDAVVEILVPVFIPFNLIKAGINSAAAFLVYKFIEKVAVRE